MIQSGSYWQAWKWGIAAVLFACAIVAIFAQYKSFQYVGIVGERTDGLSAPYSNAEIVAPAMIAEESQPSEQVAAV